MNKTGVPIKMCGRGIGTQWKTPRGRWIGRVETCNFLVASLDGT